MKHLLSIFVMGSEVRQFVHSGLFSELMNSGWGIAVMSKIVDADIRDQLPDDIELIPMLKISNSLAALTTTQILDKAFNLRRARRSESTWQYGKVVSKNWRQALLNSSVSFLAKVVSLFPGLIKLGCQFEHRLYQKMDRKVWKDFLVTHQIDAILVNVPKQPYWNPLLITAQELGIKTYLTYHTVKDIIANPRLNHPFTGIGVWNTRMKADLLRQNPWVNPKIVKVVGCGHFDCVGRTEWLPNESDFRKQIGAMSDSSLILYPTSGPGIVPQEERYIQLVIDAVRSLETILGQKIQIVFRMNPMDNRDVLYDHLKQSYPEHVVLRPDWQDNRKSNWTYARKSDPILYNALLHYSSLCITIPSTVTVDCALSGLPVINLGIEVPGEQPLAGSIRAFWDIDFNRNVRETGAAKFVTTSEDLENALRDYLQEKSIDADKRELLFLREVDGIRAGQSSLLSLEMING